MVELVSCCGFFFFFFQAEDGIRDYKVTGVQTCALPISWRWTSIAAWTSARCRRWAEKHSVPNSDRILYAFVGHSAERAGRSGCWTDWRRSLGPLRVNLCELVMARSAAGPYWHAEDIGIRRVGKRRLGFGFDDPQRTSGSLPSLGMLDSYHPTSSCLSSGPQLPRCHRKEPEKLR